MSDEFSTLVDLVEHGSSTVSSRSGALWTGPHLGWQGDETSSRAFDTSIYYLIPSYNERHGLQRQREAGRLALGRRVAAEEREGRLVHTGVNGEVKGLSLWCACTMLVDAYTIQWQAQLTWVREAATIFGVAR